MTMTLPVYAKKGGNKAPTIVTMTGGIDYNLGAADVRDTRTKIVVRINANKAGKPMTFIGWHPLVVNEGPHTQFEFEFYVQKTDGVLENVIFFVFAWGDYVMQGTGEADGDSGEFTVTIKEGYVIKRGHGNQPAEPKGQITFPVSFTVTY